jgi:hypothetical protein
MPTQMEYKEEKEMDPHACIRNFRFSATGEMCTLIVCLSANGDSSYRDAASVARLMTQKFESSVIIMCDSPRQTFDVPKSVTIMVLKDRNDCLRQIETYVRQLAPASELLFVLSAHGYSRAASGCRRVTELNGRSEYVTINGVPIYDYELFTALYGQMRKETQSLCLIDTCHSGTMLDLEYISTDGGSQFTRSKQTLIHHRPLSVCISACDDNELSGEDISVYGGWGGKLICRFLDYVQEHTGTLDVLAFHRSVFTVFIHQQHQRSRPIISYNM